LSATELLDAPAWAALSAIGIDKLVLPPEARDIVIAIDRDRDGFGERAARRAAARWAGEGRRVRLVIPNRVGADPNDLLREAHHVA
jgi:putative DNA primase/helicase